MALALWIAFLALWSWTLLACGAVSARTVPWAAALMGVLYLASGVLLKEKVKLSRGGVAFLLVLAGLFLIQLLPVAPLLFPYTAHLRELHGVGQLWPGTADTFWTVRTLAQFSTYVLSGLFVLRMRQAGLTTSQILTGFLAVLSLEAAYGLAQQFSGIPNILFYGPRPSPDSASGTLVNRNNFGGLMAMGLVLAVVQTYKRMRRNWDKGLAWGLLAALFGVALVLSKSRGGALAALAGVTLLPFLHRGRASFVAAAAVLAMGGVAVVLANPADLLQRFGRLDPFELSSDVRWTLFTTTSTAALKQPVLGFGWGTHPVAYHPFQPPGLKGQVHHAHNEYVNIFFEAGAIGLLAVIGALALWLIRVWRTQRTLSGSDRLPLIAAMATVATVAIHSMADFDLRITSIGILFASLIAMGSYAARNGTPRATWPVAAVSLASAAALWLSPLLPDSPRYRLGVSPYDYGAAWARALEDRRIGSLELAADLWPAHADLQREAGLIFLKIGDRERAGKCLKRLFEQDPEAVRDFTERMTDLTTDLLPDTPGAHAVFAGVLARQGQWEEAEEVFRKGVPERLENAVWFDYYAVQLEAAGQWGLEAILRDRRLRLKSDPGAYAAASRSWLRLGAYDRSLEKARMAERIEPGKAQWSGLCGEILESKGSRREAAEAYTAAIAKSPAELEWRLRRGLLLLHEKTFSLAAEDLREVVRARPLERRAVMGLARAFIGERLQDRARLLLSSWLQKHPEDPEATALRDSLSH